MLDPIFDTLGFQCEHFIPWIDSEKFKNIHARERNEQLQENTHRERGFGPLDCTGRAFGVR